MMLDLRGALVGSVGVGAQSLSPPESVGWTETASAPPLSFSLTFCDVALCGPQTALMPKGVPTDLQKKKDQVNRGHALQATLKAHKKGDIEKKTKAQQALKKGKEDNARGYGLAQGQKYKKDGKTEKAEKTFSTVGKKGYHKH